jgi:hypothetical protein
MSRDTTNEILKQLLYAIWSLKTDWEVYRQLYGEQPAVNELNRRTGHFFGTIQHIFPDRVILAVANLVDNDRRVLSFHRAIRELRLRSNDARLGPLTRQVRTLTKDCHALVEHRNKRIAHNDTDVAVATRRLDSVTVKTIGDAIAKAEQLYDAITAVHDGSAASWDMKGFTGVDSLLKVLTAGNNALDAKRMPNRSA